MTLLDGSVKAIVFISQLYFQISKIKQWGHFSIECLIIW